MIFMLKAIYFIVAMGIIIGLFIATKKDNRYRSTLVLTEIILLNVYVIMRFISIPYHSVKSIICGGLLLGAELFGIIKFLTLQYVFYKSEKTKVDFKFDKSYKPSVDILVCVYNEDVNIIEKTVLACTNLKYAKDKYKVWICDDGRREEIKNLGSKYGVGYITRSDNKYAKAGNINNALKNINGDLFVILDADMMPKKNFLTKTVGYFCDEQLALVQTPQAFYNPDMYQYHLNRNIPNEHDFFMRDLEETKSSINSVLDVGTNNVYRRKHVEEIGGFPTEFITEDMAIGMQIQAAGHKTLFVNEELALGLSPYTFTDLIKQRDRWCRGNIQVMKSYGKVFKKLNFAQKISYLSAYLFWFTSLQNIVFMLCPIMYLVFKIPLVEIDLLTTIAIMTPYFVGQVLVLKSRPSKYFRFAYSVFYEMAVTPHLCFAIIKELLGIKIKFNVTTKTRNNTRSYFQFNVVLPHIILLSVVLASWIIGIYNMKNGSIHYIGYIITVAWSIYNVVGLVGCIRLAYQKPIYRKSERAIMKDSIKIILENSESGSIEGYIHDIADDSMGVKLTDKYNFAKMDSINVKVNNKNYELNLKGNVARCEDGFVGIKLKGLNQCDKKSIMSIYMDNITAYY